MKRTAKLAAAVLVAALLASPLFAARGSADFTRFVAIGDSYGAGVVGASLNERHQPWSWPAVIARQAGLKFCAPNAAAADPCWAQPLVSFPGIGPELLLMDLKPTIAPAPGMGSPIMTTFGRPYNNLSIPGATVGAVLTLTGAEPPSQGEPTAVSMARFILRGQGTAVQQALAQQPTFIAVWIGGNDALVSMFAGTPAAMTPAADFKTRYEAMLNGLVAGAPNAGMVVGNIPMMPVPYALVIKPYIVDPATGKPVLGPDNKEIYYIADLGGGTIGQLPAGSLVLLHARTKLATGYGFPPVPPFTALPDVGKPLADSDVITPTEMAAIFTRIGEYNTAIVAAATARGIPVADINGLFSRVYRPTGLQVGPITVTAAPVTGGFFSTDFFHLTDLGYMLFANEYIRAIRNAYESDIPVAGIWQLWANNGAFFPEAAANFVASGDGSFMSQAAIDSILSQWVSVPQDPSTTDPQPPPSAPGRRRGAGH